MSIAIRTCQFCNVQFQPRQSPHTVHPFKFCSKVCCDKSKAVPLIDQFYRYVGRKQPNGCILWTGTTTKDGYGRISKTIANSKRQAHRISYELFVGPIHDSLFVLHRCDNPLCINPTHLFLGTHQDNMTDMLVKGRSSRGERNRHAKLTESQVVEITNLRARGVALKTIVQMFGINRGSVWCIVSKKTWKNIER